MSNRRTVCRLAAAAVALLPPPALAADEQATYQQDRTIAFPDVEGRYGLASFCLAGDGNLVVCLARAPQLRVVSKEGKLLATWKLPFLPHALCAGPQGTVYVGGGESQVIRLDGTGKLLKTAKLPTGLSRYHRVTCLAADGQDLYVGFRNEGGFTVYRYDLDFGSPQQVLKGLRGCCSQLGFTVREGVLYVADNTRHRVARYDRAGTLLSAWGRRSRDERDPEGFAGCCNPMNLCFAPDGALVTSESTLGRVKRFSPEGKPLGLVATYKTAVACKHVAVAVRPDGGEAYVIDVGENVIRVFKPVSAAPVAATAAALPPRR